MAAHVHAPSAAAGPGGWRAFVAGFTVERLLLAGMLATIAAALLNPVFVTPFTVLLARMLAIAGALLVAYAAATAWPVPALPRWLTPLLAVALAAPLATFAVYLVSVEGDVAALLKSEPSMTGFVLVTVTVLAIAPLVTLVMLYRERDAQARNEALQFALQKSTLERQALDAQIKLLHAQIEPHFLFNTLANVQELVESGSPRAAPVLASLIAYLRAAMPTLNNEAATLGEEAALVLAYLALMHMRMPDRLAYEVDIPAALAYLEFPAMALLTLVENAVHHGIDPSEQGGRIDVSARLDPVSGRVTVGVVDTGMGIDAKAAAGTGLANLRARLAARYGPDAQLELAEQAPHGVRAEITLLPRAPA